jgi:hypothetical protein
MSMLSALAGNASHSQNVNITAWLDEDRVGLASRVTSRVQAVASARLSNTRQGFVGDRTPFWAARGGWSGTYAAFFVSCTSFPVSQLVRAPRTAWGAEIHCPRGGHGCNLSVLNCLSTLDQGRLTASEITWHCLQRVELLDANFGLGAGDSGSFGSARFLNVRPSWVMWCAPPLAENRHPFSPPI